MSTKVGKIDHKDSPLEFPAKLEHLYEMLAYIKQAATDVGFSNTQISKIELASEEALVNVISHGFIKRKAGIISINCKLELGKFLTVTIQDDGVPFDPVEAIKNFDPEGNDDKPVEETRVGGYGIYFIVNIMDSVDYQYVDNKNVLTLTKRL